VVFDPASICSTRWTLTSAPVSSRYRGAKPQYNAVRQALGHVLMRGDAAELEGFTAALTEIVAFGDESGDYFRDLGTLADRRERIIRRLVKRREAQAVRT
jgi:hypothetical protein